MHANEKLTVKQIAHELSVEDRTVRRWIKSKQLRTSGYDIRGRYLVKRSDLDVFIQRRTQGKEDE